MGSLHVDRNFGSGRSLRELDLAGAKSASTEVQRDSLTAPRVLYG